MNKSIRMKWQEMIGASNLQSDQNSKRQNRTPFAQDLGCSVRVSEEEEGSRIEQNRTSQRVRHRQEKSIEMSYERGPGDHYPPPGIIPIALHSSP